MHCTIARYEKMKVNLLWFYSQSMQSFEGGLLEYFINHKFPISEVCIVCGIYFTSTKNSYVSSILSKSLNM